MINPHVVRLSSLFRFRTCLNRWRRPHWLLLMVGFLAIGSESLAQVNLRGSFPGRRVGGGTRGECTARLVANLVPPSNVFAPGSTGLIAILQGPSANLHPLSISFKAANASGAVEPATKALLSRELAPTPTGIVLLKAPPLSGNTLWESSYRCDGGSGDADPLGFISAGAPPSVSLLVKTSEPVDKDMQLKLAQLNKHCGGTMAKQQIAKDFGIDELLSSDWPDLIPVRCL